MFVLLFYAVENSIPFSAIHISITCVPHMAFIIYVSHIIEVGKLVKFDVLGKYSLVLKIFCNIYCLKYVKIDSTEIYLTYMSLVVLLIEQ